MVEVRGEDIKSHLLDLFYSDLTLRRECGGLIPFVTNESVLETYDK
jgi:hypothetical protein